MDRSHDSRRAFPVNVISLLFLLTHFHLGPSQEIPVWANGTFSGTTIRASTGIINGFSMYDNFKEVGLGGQVILSLSLSAFITPFTDLSISSCESSSFETYIAMLDANPFKTNASIIAEGANDVNCKTSEQRAYLTTRLAPGQYYIVVTGLDRQEGRYNLSIIATPVNPSVMPWGLDRVDQRDLPLNRKYKIDDGGEDIWVYLIDSGVRASHEQLRGRVVEGHDFINNRMDSAPDCTGHGTHVAGIIVGASTGVARRTRIIAVRVFGCDNKARTADIVDAIHWVMLNSKERSIRRNCVIALMFAEAAESVQNQRPLRSVMRALRKSRIPVIVPSGNNAKDSCSYFPSSLDTFVSVSATDREDFRASFSNYGNCTDIYAPGEAILSSWHTSDTARRTISGTRQAVGYMAGVVAVLSSVNRGITGERVKGVLESISTQNVVDNLPDEGDSRFAFVRSVPKVKMEKPELGEVHIFAIIQVEFDICTTTAKLATLRNVFTDVVKIEADHLDVNCSSSAAAASSSMIRQDELVENGFPIMLRFELYERDATMAFRTLEEVLSVGKSAIESRLGHPFVVREEPWAFAADGFIYWGVPKFFDENSRRLSAGQIAGIVVGCLFAICIIAITIWVCYRKVFKVDKVGSMEGSADHDEGPVLFGEPTSPTSPSRLRSLVRVMSFRNAGLVRLGSTSGAPAGDGSDLLRTESEADKPDDAVPRDMVRLSSFGGEAFAQVAGDRTDADGQQSPKMLSKEMSMLNVRNQGPALSSRMESQADFGAANNGPGDGNAAVRLDSVGGEAFLSVSDQSSDKNALENV